MSCACREACGRTDFQTRGRRRNAVGFFYTSQPVKALHLISDPLFAETILTLHTPQSPCEMNPLLTRHMRAQLSGVDVSIAPWKSFLASVSKNIDELQSEHRVLSHT